MEKTCTIPNAKAILVPILNIECSYVENKNEKTTDDLRNCASSFADQMQALKVSYDGIDIPDEEIHQKYRVASSPFIVNFPPKNVFNAAPPGNSTAVSDGYWILFNAPSPGKHDIIFGGCFGNPTVVDPAKFCQDVTYHLKVLAP
jgi:hypothetical protein